MRKYGVPINQIPKARRSAFVAEEGHALLGPDYSAAESHITSYVTGDEGYIEAHEGEWDTHTLVASQALPGLGWPSEPGDARAFAESYITSKGKSLRDVFKGVQHASNYLGTEYTVARQVGITVKEASEFQTGYFRRYPNIPLWHEWLKKFIRRNKCVVIPGFGFVRETFGRYWAEETFRELVACIPQGFLALYAHQAMMNCWNEMWNKGECRFILHNHDQLVFQIPEDKAEFYQAAVKPLMEWPIDVEDFQGKTRTLRLRAKPVVGRSWKDVS